MRPYIFWTNIVGGGVLNAPPYACFVKRRLEKSSKIFFSYPKSSAIIWAVSYFDDHCGSDDPDTPEDINIAHLYKGYPKKEALT